MVTKPAEPQRPKIRKACDLCYRKRIKCDGQTPRCTHCQIYSCQCTHQAARRRKKPPKDRQVQSSRPFTSTNDQTFDISCEGALANDIGDRALGHRNSLALIVTNEPYSTLENAVRPTAADNPNFNGIILDTPSLPWDTDLLHQNFEAPTQMEMPPENFVRQLIDVYLTNINTVVPMFDPQHLTRTIDQWYNGPSQRSRTSWALLNVVMAISQHCTFGQIGFGSADISIGSVTDCLNKAQSALTEILMGDATLENLQIVLGLVTIFQGTSDIRPAVFLMSTAVRLSQVLGLHRSDGDFYGDISPREALQRRRVFWITYILDRDIAMRIGQAPIQQDADIDIDLPPKTPEIDAAGFVSSPGIQPDGFNVFRARIELAQIQGQLYDTLFSVRSKRQSPGKKAGNSQAIRLLLKDWKARIPMTLRADALSQTQSHIPYIPSFFCAMYGTVLTCLGQLCQVNSMDFRWVNQLRKYGRSLTVSLDHPCLPPAQPQGWNALVNHCREFMPLFNSVQDKGPAFLWMNICPYASGLVCLSANSMIDFDNRDSLEHQDRRLKAEAVSVLGEMSSQTNHKTLTKVLDAFTELDFQYQFMTAI